MILSEIKTKIIISGNTLSQFNACSTPWRPSSSPEKQYNDIVPKVRINPFVAGRKRKIRIHFFRTKENFLVIKDDNKKVSQ